MLFQRTEVSSYHHLCLCNLTANADTNGQLYFTSLTPLVQAEGSQRCQSIVRTLGKSR